MTGHAKIGVKGHALKIVLIHVQSQIVVEVARIAALEAVLDPRQITMAQVAATVVVVVAIPVAVDANIIVVVDVKKHVLQDVRMHATVVVKHHVFMHVKQHVKAFVILHVLEDVKHHALFSVQEGVRVVLVDVKTHAQVRVNLPV